MSDSPSIRNHAAFIWSVADLLRGDYKQSEYGKVILPLVVLRRLDCVLAATKPQVLARYAAVKDRIENYEPVLTAASGEQFFNTSAWTSVACSTIRRTSVTTCAATSGRSRRVRVM